MQANDETKVRNVGLRLCSLCMQNDEEKFSPNGVDFGVDQGEYKIIRCSLDLVVFAKVQSSQEK